MRWRSTHCALLLMFSVVAAPITAASARQGLGDAAVCDPLADYFLGVEDYPEAIRLHSEILARDPNNALAHYHLGFAYGSEGQTGKEIHEYERAVALGLHIFDLFLNLGVARFERGDLVGATGALNQASSLSDPQEVHFDLALVYERRTMLPEAESEILRALAKQPNDPEYLNILAVIAAEKGDAKEAGDIWIAILSRHPQYASAAANLRSLRALHPETPTQKFPGGQLREQLVGARMR